MEESNITGVTIADLVVRLKSSDWSLKKLHGIFVAWIAATHIYKRSREMRQLLYRLELV